MIKVPNNFSTLPKSYYNNNGCHDCKHVFIYMEIDHGVDYFCTFKAEPRPLCLSVGMDEVPDLDRLSMTKEKYDKVWGEYCQNWNKWYHKYMVHPWGICKNYETK